MYDPSGEMTQVIRSSKKHPDFVHESRPHVEYFINKIEQEAEMYPDWEFTPLNKA